MTLDSSLSLVILTVQPGGCAAEGAVSVQEMSNREMWASLAFIAGLITYLVELPFGAPDSVSMLADLVMVTGLVFVWLERKRRISC
ncbi:hypothetical protein [Streptomyces sp. KR55]|uniref:hypothetical protein n=1 Tax=Streptomyces sp. KR55 TaxID=3457425 RepID=UPI003FD3A930